MFNSILDSYRANPRHFFIRAATLFGGLYFFAEYLTPEAMLVDSGLNAIHEPVTNGFIVMGGMAIGLGLINLLTVHGSRVAFLRKGWVNSIALLSGMILTLIITLSMWVSGMSVNREIAPLRMLSSYATAISKSVEESNSVTSEDLGKIALLSKATEQSLVDIERVVRDVGEKSAVSLSGTTAMRLEIDRALTQARGSTSLLTSTQGISVKNELSNFSKVTSNLASTCGEYFRFVQDKKLISKAYSLLYDGLFIPLGSAMFALLGVYIASAAYRAFRITSLESTLMMVTAAVVILGQVSIGIEGENPMAAIRQWLLEVPNSAAFRAIRIGAAIAGLLLALRMWLSIQSSPGSSTREVE